MSKCIFCKEPCGYSWCDYSNETKKEEDKMTLVEAIKTGKPHRRKNDNYVYIVPHVGGVGYSQEDVMAEDWIVGDGITSLIPKPKKVEGAEVIDLTEKFNKD